PRGGGAGRLPQSLCTINPLHGEAGGTSEVRTAGRSVRVPVCEDCRADLRAGNQLQWIFDEGRPYVEGTSVWADRKSDVEGKGGGGGGGWGGDGAAKDETGRD